MDLATRVLGKIVTAIDHAHSSSSIASLLHNLSLSTALFPPLAAAILFLADIHWASALPQTDAYPIQLEMLISNFDSDAAVEVAPVIHRNSTAATKTPSRRDLDSSWDSFVRTVFQKLYPLYVGGNGIDCPIVPVETPQFMVKMTDPKTLFVSNDGELLGVQLAVVKSLEPNSIALPADDSLPARVILSTGLLEKVSSESELAFVIAHEIAHIRLGHFPPYLPFAMLSDEQLRQISLIHQGWELDADNRAFSDLARAGFDLAGASNLLEKLSVFERRPGEAELEAVANGGLMHNHPGIDVRLSALKDYRISLRSGEAMKLAGVGLPSNS